MNIFKTCVTRFETSRYILKIRPGHGDTFLSSGGFGDIFSNENSLAYKYRSRVSTGAYLGIGSHQNFDHICRTQPSSVVLVDVSTKVVDHLIAFRAALKLTQNPFEFLCLIGSIMSISDARQLSIATKEELERAINKYIFRTDRELDREPVGNSSVADVNLAYAKSELGDSEEYQILARTIKAQCDQWNFNCTPSRVLLKTLFIGTFYTPYLGERNNPQAYQNRWLRSLDAFGILRDLAVNNRIAIIEGDITDAEVASSICQGLSSCQRPERIAAAYFSNVDECVLFAGAYEGYVKSLRALLWVDKPIVLRSFSYAVGHKVDPDRYYNELKDPFFYQVLEGPLARFFEEESLPKTKAELVKAFLFREAERRLLLVGAPLANAREFVRAKGNHYFSVELMDVPSIAYLDIPLLLNEYQEWSGAERTFPIFSPIKH